MSIHYRPGKLNQSADSLSRCALNEVGCVDVTVDTPPRQTASASELQSQIPSAKDREDVPLDSIPLETSRGEVPLNVRQALDPELQIVMKYLQTGVLPMEDKKARELILGKTRYVVIDDTLYHATADMSLRIVLPTSI